MEKELQYLLSANLLLLLVWGYYRLLLARQSRFTWNRSFLLIGMALASILPLLRVPFEGAALSQFAIFRTLPEVLIGKAGAELSTSGDAFPWTKWLFATYALIAVLLVGLLCLRTGRLIWRIARSPRQSKAGYTLVQCAPSIGPASFFRYLFWDAALDEDPESAAVILAHEKCHIRQWHSLDLLFAELLVALFWFNPAVYRLRIALRHNHEFLADRAAARVGGQHALAQLVLARQFGPSGISLVNHFHSQIKARITMLKQKSGHKALVRYFMILPFLGLMLACTSLDRDPAEEAGIVAEKVDGKAPVSATGSQEGQDQLPKPLNMSEIASAIGYPKPAEDAEMEGKVLVKVKVSRAGTYLEHKVLSSPDDVLTEAVEAHLAKLKFAPGIKDGKEVETWVTIPFMFKLKQ